MLLCTVGVCKAPGRKASFLVYVWLCVRNYLPIDRSAAPSEGARRMAHSHNHGGGHSHDDANPDDDWNLYQHLERAEALNAVVLGEGDTTWAPNATGKALCIMRPNARRLQQGQILSSDSDEQVIVKLQFAAPVSVRKLMARPQPKTRHPGSGTVGHPRLKARAGVRRPPEQSYGG